MNTSTLIVSLMLVCRICCAIKGHALAHVLHAHVRAYMRMHVRMCHALACMHVRLHVRAVPVHACTHGLVCACMHGYKGRRCLVLRLRLCLCVCARARVRASACTRICPRALGCMRACACVCVCGTQRGGNKSEEPCCGAQVRCVCVCIMPIRAHRCASKHARVHVSSSGIGVPRTPARTHDPQHTRIGQSALLANNRDLHVFRGCPQKRTTL